MVVTLDNIWQTIICFTQHCTLFAWGGGHFVFDHTVFKTYIGIYRFFKTKQIYKYRVFPLFRLDPYINRAIQKQFYPVLPETALL